MENDKEKCAITTTVNVIGGKWKAPILWHLINNTRRFSEIRRLIPEITQKMLTQQLRELEADGLIHRKVYAEVPPRVDYSLTDYGRTLIPVLNVMAQWGSEHDSDLARSFPNDNSERADEQRANRG